MTIQVPYAMDRLPLQDNYWRKEEQVTFHPIRRLVLAQPDGDTDLMRWHLLLHQFDNSWDELLHSVLANCLER